MLRFESLGDNCEFGLVQRKAGAEPLGLLRFSSAPPDILLAALRSRFDGMGEDLHVRPGPSGRDYMVEDRRTRFVYHAWVSVGSMGPEEIVRRETRRVPFLVRKLIEDLTLGEKLFVYHSPRCDAAMAAALAEAVRSYGPGTLLRVSPADPANPPGSVRWDGPGLMRGYVDRFAPGENAYDFSFDCWMTLCREARRLVTEGQKASVASGVLV